MGPEMMSWKRLKHILNVKELVCVCVCVCIIYFVNAVCCV